MKLKTKNKVELSYVESINISEICKWNLPYEKKNAHEKAKIRKKVKPLKQL